MEIAVRSKAIEIKTPYERQPSDYQQAKDKTMLELGTLEKLPHLLRNENEK